MTPEQVEGAKRQMIQEVVDIDSSGVLRAQDIALMGLNLGSVWSQDEIFAAINAVDIGAVQVMKQRETNFVYVFYLFSYVTVFRRQRIIIFCAYIDCMA